MEQDGARLRIEHEQQTQRLQKLETSIAQDYASHQSEIEALKNEFHVSDILDSFVAITYIPFSA